VNVIVCMKQVPDTETLIKVKPDGSGIVTDDIKYVMNVYCEFAVEESLRIKEKQGGASILVTMGPARAVEALRTGLAMGSDRSIHLNDPAFEGADGYATAKALAEAIKKDSARVAISGYTDKTGDVAKNEELAKNRATAVRDALKAAGIAESGIEMRPPLFVEQGAGGGDAEARRVEISKL